MNKLDKDYNNLIQKIIEKGNKKGDRTGTGTHSLFGESITHDMSTGFPILTTKKVFHRGTIEELIWFMKGKTDLRSLVNAGVNIWVGDAYKKYKNVLESIAQIPYDSQEKFLEQIKIDDRFSNQWGDLGRIYGAQWRNWLGFQDGYDQCADLNVYSPTPFNPKDYGTDQLLNLIHDLKANPDSRRLIVTAWQPSELEEMTLPPCHYGFQCYTRELSLDERANFYYEKNKDWTIIKTDKFLDGHNIPKRTMSLMWNQRSVDSPLGLPFNITSYGALLHILCAITNMIPETLKGSFGDCHVYNNQIDGVNEQIKRENIFDLPKLKLKGEFDNIKNYWTEDGFDLDTFLDNISTADFELVGYNSHEKIFFPLSN